MIPRKKFHRVLAQQQASNKMKNLIAHDNAQADPKYQLFFDFYSDANHYQFGAVMIQNNRAITFFTRKLNNPQQLNTTTEEFPLRSIKTLMEFKEILL